MASMKNNLDKKAFALRQKILKIVIKRGGHLATSLSSLDILVSLFYSGVLNFKNTKPNWEFRDRFILSKGHAETLIYSVLDDLKFFPKTYFENHYRAGKFLLGGHTDCKVPGIEFTAGALGHGLSLACGTALALKRKKNNSKVFVLMSDGECTEGSVWEAAIFASHHKLDNLIVIVDNNRISATDFLINFTNISNLTKKFQSFGWNSKNIDGHSISKMNKIFKNIKKNNSKKPTIFIAKTIKGKGINFIENDPSRHTKGLNKEEEIKAMRILNIDENK
jgi:transketolase